MITGRELARVADTVRRHSFLQLSARLWNRSLWRFHTRPLSPLPSSASPARDTCERGEAVHRTHAAGIAPSGRHVEAEPQGRSDVETANNVQRFRQGGKALAIRAMAGDRASHRALVASLEDWLAGRTPYMDVAMAPMNTALRILEWSWVLLLLGRSSLLAPDLSRRMQTSLRRQARRLARHIEYEVPGNHPCFNFAALWMADALLQDRPGSIEGWAKLFEHEFARSVLPDGFHVELSTHYHLQMVRLGEEYCGFATGIAGHVAPDFRDALDRARRAASLFVLGDDVPLLGDSSYSFLEESLRGDVATLRALAPQVFGSASTNTASPRCLEAVGGPPLHEEFPGAQASPGRGATETHWLPEAGYLVCRHHASTSDGLFVLDAGPLGFRRNPGHGHSDLLSVVLYVAGQSVLVDPGTLRYANDAEALWYKRAVAHNTVFVDGEDHGDLWTFFRWCALPERPSLSFAATSTGVAVTAETMQYRKGLDVRHRRDCRLDWRGSLDIVDVMACGPGVRGVVGVSYHFAPGCTLAAHPGQDRWDCTVGRHRIAVTIRPTGEGTHCTTTPGSVAPEYGVTVAAPVIRVIAKASPAVRIATRFEWPRTD